MLTHLEVLVEQSQFGDRLEPVVLLPARNHRLCGCIGAVAENQVLHPPVKEKEDDGAEVAPWCIQVQGV